jgi:hypothetical protein
MVSDPAFREAVADRQHVIRRTVSVSGQVPTKRIEVELVHGTEQVPAFAKKFVGSEIPIRQVETWRTDTEADVHVTIPGKPGDMTGTSHIAQVGDAVVQTVELAVQVKIPLVGGKIEDLISGLMVKALKAENRVGLSWLAGSAA